MLNLLSLKTTLVTVLGLFAFVLLPSFATADSGDYVYKQTWMPKETVEIDLSKTAMFVTDPQNDFLSDKSPAWGLVGPTVIKHKVVEKEKMLKTLAKELGVAVFSYIGHSKEDECPLWVESRRLAN